MTITNWNKDTEMIKLNRIKIIINLFVKKNIAASYPIIIFLNADLEELCWRNMSTI